ncbi:ROK family protein [Nesterenkonia sp. MY13]|uniref:ROK family protein n=1 Tax=Nesterenkonia sedimenti TaxID=1463632 RepID=A0A7X8THM7_9MICC|nr:ROK family protein [Nesterenkonia sedimenti]NLS08701.1 ROK family protein [Nesterenkonia sedimenti]
MTSPEATVPAAQALGPASQSLPKLPESAIGIDVGGTGIKGGIVDLASGELRGERFRIPTPKPATPDAVAEVIGQILQELLARPEAPAAEDLSVGVTFPAIVIDNVVLTASNIDPAWINCDTSQLLSDLPGRTFTLNDADAAGLAEARYGAGNNLAGTMMTVTLGTGVGTALIHDGVLIPNNELGHAQFEGEVKAENKVSAASRERLGMDWPEYGEVLRRYLVYLERIQPVNRFIIGGGISQNPELFMPYVTGLRAEVVIAQLVNNAGISGAALFAAEQARLADSQSS